ALRQKELSESKLQTQLTAAENTEQRLTAEIATYKAEYQQLNQKLDVTTEQKHLAEKRLENALTDNTGQAKRVTDLQERLEKAEQSVNQERALANQLKDALAEEGKKAKQLEASNSE
ncbi:MAG: hypothetical protein ACKO96_42380, partial [Flammeovirgaceae bacterium]